MAPRLLFFSALLAFFAFNVARAQAPEQDCINAIPVCQAIYHQNSSYTGSGTYPAELGVDTNVDCLRSGELNDVWYVINVTSPGVLAFDIIPNVGTEDYDFAIWDITGVGCQALYDYTTRKSNNFLPVGCNYAGGNPPTGKTGLSTTLPSPYAYDTALNVVAGQTFVLNISNFSASQNGYTLDFTPSTASIYDTVKPKITGVFTHCQFPSDQLTIKTSEPVKCNSITPTASEWSITPAGGTTPISASGLNCGTSQYSATNTIIINLSGILPPGNYTLNLTSGTDNNTLLDNCGNAASDTAFAFTIVNPVPMQIISVDTPACISARIHLDRPVKCSTIDADGSDFAVTGPGTVQVMRASPASCSAVGLTDAIDIFFAQSIYTPGTYTITLQTGNDGDVLVDTCGIAASGTKDFAVSDAGYVEANATPSVLCAPGYVNLTAQAFIPPPPPTLTCGTNGTACSTTSANYTPDAGTTASTTATTPLKGSYSDAHTQQLFRSYELSAAGMHSGTITQLGLNVSAHNSVYAYDEFTIKIGCTGVNSLSDFEQGTSVVYGPVSFTPAVGANNFPLDQAFDWDGKSNLVVDICYHIAGGNSSSDDIVQATTGLLPGSTFQAQSVGINGCALTASSSTGPATASAARANITFTECRPPAPPQSFLWRPGAYLHDSTQQNTSAYAPQTSTYQVQILDSNYCYRRDTAMAIVSFRHPSIDHDTSICLGDVIQINAFGGLTYNWYPATGLNCTDCPSPFASPVVTTSYNAVIADEYGCADTLDINVTVHPLPVVRITPHDTTITYGVPVQLFVKASSARQYYWTPAAGLDNSISANPIANPQTTTDYVVIVTDTNNCRGSDTALVQVRTGVPVNIPTAFTPNGDGRNDFFGVFNLSFQRVIEFRVFNRWGTEVFSTQDSHTPWDGTYKGKPQPAGVYQYLIRVTWPDGNAALYKGDVTLIR